MTCRLETLEHWAAGLLGQLEPSSCNKLARSVGLALRRSQQKRIVAQRNPDGSKYAPRKQRNLRSKKDRMKRKTKMYQKLCLARFLKVQVHTNAISAGFAGRTARIAKVHQYGLKDRAEPRSPEVKFEQRVVLGLTDPDLDLIKNQVLAYFNSDS